DCRGGSYPRRVSKHPPHLVRIRQDSRPPQPGERVPSFSSARSGTVLGKSRSTGDRIAEPGGGTLLNLALRDEFLGIQHTETAIALRRSDATGAAQQPPQKILEITYPTADIQTALRALSANRPAKPIVLLGDRGCGKSHIMSVMHHATASPDVVEQWAHDWGN